MFASSTTQAQRESQTPDPETLYPEHLRGRHAGALGAAQVLPRRQAHRCREGRPGPAGRVAPLCTTDQLAGLMGGVTRRRVNQVL